MASFLKKWLARASVWALLSTLLVPAGIQFQVPVTYAATYTVTNTNDSGAGSLRQAITDANANIGTDSIACDAALSGTITLSTALPQLTESLDLDCSGSASAVTVSGTLLMGLDLEGTSTSYTIKGIRLTGLATGIKVGSNVTSATIGGTGSAAEAVYINDASTVAIDIDGDGVNVQNTTIGNLTTVYQGIDISSGSSVVNIGNTGTNGAVTISASNSSNGITIAGSTVTIVATTISNALNAGVGISSGASNVIIGGTTSSARNVLKSNGYGVTISGGTTIDIRGNYIGIAADGTTAAPNASAGIYTSGGTGVTIGGSSASYGNVISGHSGLSDIGINIDTGSGTTTIQNNYIGTNAAGTGAIANSYGIINRVSNTIISNNVISGNSGTGIRIDESDASISGLTISNNVIGLNAAGSAAIANGDGGIYFANSSGSNTISSVTIQDNIISGNTGKGIDSSHTDISSINVWGNKIGTNAAGTTDLGNTGNGIVLKGNNWNLDASSDSSKRNIIIGNGGSCISITGDSNIVKGNYCGIGSDGTTEVANDSTTITLGDGSDNNVIGGITAGAENLICAPEGLNVNLMFNGGTGNGNTLRGNDVKCSVEVPIVALGGTIAPMILKYGAGTANDSLSAPTISSATDSTVSGTGACASCTVDLYTNTASDGGLYLTSTTADGSGNFSFTGLSLASYTKVIATHTNGSGSTSPSTLGFTITHSTAPTIASISGAETTNGTGDVTATVTTIDDADDDNVQLKFEYSNDGGATWYDPTLATASTGTLNNAQTYQVSSISTASGAVSSFTITWAAATDLSSTTDITNAKLRVTPYDGVSTGSVSTSSSFNLDLADPVAPTLTYNATETGDSASISGNTEDGSSIYINGVDSGTDSDGSGDFTITGSPIVPGVNTFSIYAVDAYGNQGTASVASVTRPSQHNHGTPTVTTVTETTTEETAPSTDTTEESMAGEEEPAPTEVAPVETETPEETVVETPTESTEPEITATEEPTATETATEETVSPAIGSDTITELSDTQAQTNFSTQAQEAISPREVYADQEPVRQSIFTSGTSETASETASLIQKSDLFSDVTEDGIPEILITLSGEDVKDFNSKGDDDQDGLTNGEELAYSCTLSRKDSDGDSLSDLDEVFAGTDCGSYDTDMDGISDASDSDPLNPNRLVVTEQKESTYLAELTKNLEAKGESVQEISIKTTDFDLDGIADWEELRIGTDPMVADSDADGLLDGTEVLNYGTDPSKANQASDLRDLRITNVTEESFVPEGAQVFSGRGTPNTNVYLYRLNEKGKEILMGKTETDPAGLFHMVAYGFDIGDSVIYATSGASKTQIKDMSQIMPLSVVEDTGVKTPEMNTDLSQLDLQEGGLPLSAKEGQKLVVTWHSAVLSQTLIADASGKIIRIKPQTTLEKGEHTVTWYAVDPETGLRSQPETLQFELTTAGFIRPQFVTGEQSQNMIRVLGSLVVLLSASMVILLLKKRGGIQASTKA